MLGVEDVVVIRKGMKGDIRLAKHVDSSRCRSKEMVVQLRVCIPCSEV